MSERTVVRVRDVMKPNFDMVDGLMTVKDALDAMEYVDTKALIINKRHADDEFGMVLLSDIAKKVLAKDKSPDRINVYEIMSKPILAIDPDMDIRYCARLFERFGLSRAPVVENREVIGIVSFTDMVLQGVREAAGAAGE